MSKDEKFFEPLAVRVAAGSTVRAAVIEIGCSEITGYRLHQRPDFQHRVSELRTEVTRAIVGKLTDAATRAVDTLADLLSEDQNASVRVQAAKALLANLHPVSEHFELRERLDRIESAHELRAAG